MTEQVVNNSRQTVYYVGELQEYKSKYGYPKRGHLVYRLGPGESPHGDKAGRDSPGGTGNCIGFIKEERVGDENGNMVTSVFYEKMRWRKNGLIRFYASPQALLIACDMTPVYGLGIKSDVTARVWELSQTAPRETPVIFHLGNVQPDGSLPQITYDPKPQLTAPDPLQLALNALNDAAAALVSRRKLPSPRQVVTTKSGRVAPKRPAKKVVKKAKKRAKK